MDFEEYIRSAPLDEIKIKINKYFKDDSESQTEIAVQLVLRAQITEDENEIKNIFEMLSNEFEPHPKITLHVKKKILFKF